MTDIDRHIFLATIFQDITEDEHVCVTRASVGKDGQNYFQNYLLKDRAWRKFDPEKKAAAWYFSIASVSGELNPKGTMVGRGRANLKRVYCLVLDDIGTKAKEPPVEPSWKIETSPGNFQWGYFLIADDRLDLFEALVKHLTLTLGYGDAGAGGAYRVVRVPGSANMKPQHDEWRARITHWCDDAWTLEELAEDFDCDLGNLPKESRTSRTSRTPKDGVVVMDGIDPLLDWLVDAGMVVKDTGTDWIDIVCPWADQHTTGDGTAGYSPLGRGPDNYIQTRAFRCLHEHCVSRRLKDFQASIRSAGAPQVSGYDPLPWLQAKYTYIETGQRVADLSRRPDGGRWLWELSDWKLRHPGRMSVPGRPVAVSVALAFLEHPDTRRAVDVIYKPVAAGDDAGVVDLGGQDYVNTYVPPNWVETSDEPVIFLEHVEFLLPGKADREVFLDWLAFKTQHPDKRSYAYVMVAEEVFGVGRSWLYDLLRAMWKGNVKPAKLAQLIGKGTSADQTYNDWLVGCLYLVVEESKDVDRADFFSGYETLKQHVDTRVGSVRVNPKFGRTRDDLIWFNCLIFSNHADAIALPEGDRRIYVGMNAEALRDWDYYDRLEKSLRDGEPARAYWWLMHRDVSGYDHVYPPMTDAKAAMIESTRAPSDAILDWIMETHKSDLVTKASLRMAVVRGARELDYEGIMREGSGVVRMIWRRIKSLRPGDAKHGARYFLSENRQSEVRALRNRDDWMSADKDRDKVRIENELAKATDGTNIVNIAGD